MLRYFLVVCAIIGFAKSEDQIFGNRVDGDDFLKQELVVIEAVQGEVISAHVELLLPVGWCLALQFPYYNPDQLSSRTAT